MGLGVPTELSDDERSALQQQAYEVYFSADDLREKQRKIKVIFNSLTDPKFFGDGAVKIDKVQKYISDIQLEAANVNLTTGDTAISFALGILGFLGGGVIGAAQLTQLFTSFELLVQ